MAISIRDISLTASLAAALWIVPSVGTQGMGTIGQRFSHPDDGFLAAGAASLPRATLNKLDALVLSALPKVSPER